MKSDPVTSRAEINPDSSIGLEQVKPVRGKALVTTAVDEGSTETN